MQEIQFVKMQGTGNDYVYVDCFEQNVPNPSAFAKRVSDRHFGIGSDGVIFIRQSERGDCFMDIYNADGSRGKTCGNGLRCTAFYFYKKYGTGKKEIFVETLSGVRTCYVTELSFNKAWVCVNMGKSSDVENKAFCYWELERRLPKDLLLVGVKVLDVGNVHCVLTLDKKCHCDRTMTEKDIESVDLESLAKFLQQCGMFPMGVNVEICLRDYGNTDSLCERFADKPWSAWRVRVWERGSGETFSCGSGACAVALATTKIGEKACIFMKGGRLAVEICATEEVLLSGEAVHVFSGCIF